VPVFTVTPPLKGSESAGWQVSATKAEAGGLAPETPPVTDLTRTTEQLPSRITLKILLSSPVKRLVISAAWVCFACAMWYHAAGNPLHELALINRAQRAIGYLVETRTLDREDFRDHVHFYDVGVYAFHLPDGREFMTITEAGVGKLKVQVQVEYLADNPAVNRVSGDGSRTVAGSLGRHVIGLLFLAAFMSPGVYFAGQAIRDISAWVRARMPPRTWRVDSIESIKREFRLNIDDPRELLSALSLKLGRWYPVMLDGKMSDADIAKLGAFCEAIRFLEELLKRGTKQVSS